jgi:hemolysin D
MNVTADIKTDERRMIEYFLAPMLRYKEESLRER